MDLGAKEQGERGRGHLLFLIWGSLVLVLGPTLDRVA